MVRKPGGQGGGGMGPPLIHDKWIYGGEIQNIAATILQGRPNGIPHPAPRGRDARDVAAYLYTLR